MEFDYAHLQEAANGLLQSAILGRDLGESLQRVATAGGASGAGYTKCLGDALTAVPSQSLRECLREYHSKGLAAPRSKALLVPPTTGVFATNRTIPAESLRRDSFYQDFMLRRGISCVAAARLELSGQGLYRFGFYRGEREGPFLPEETRSLDRIFPHLQAVATICQATLEKQTEDCSSRFSRNGLAALKLGRNGFVTESNPAADRFIPDLFRLSRGRITLPSRSDQGRLDRAIATAVSENAASTVFRVHGADRVQAPFLLIVPVRGPAREVFAGALAFLVVVEPTQPHCVPQPCLEALGHSLSLTPRERSVVGVVASGRDLSSAAKQFGVTIGTARNHLKSAMQKARVHSQVELAALVATLSELIAA